MKTKLILFCLLLAGTGLFAQFKVDQYGRIGMGTNWPNPGYKCHIKGNLLLTTYPSNPFIEFQFKVGNGWPGTEIGSTVDMVAFWSTWTSYHKLYAQQYFVMSDAAYKTNLTAIAQPLTKIAALKPYIYDFKDRTFNQAGDSVETLVKQYGFVAQQAESTLREVKITADGKGVKLMDYTQIIPLLTAGIQEQQKTITDMQSKLDSLLGLITDCCQSGAQRRMNTGSSDGKNGASYIRQNTPNPFNKETGIDYYIAEKNADASIIITDMTGKLLKTLKLSAQGSGTVNVSASDLAPGMYYYSLLVNNNEIDTKKMILTE